jgi:hypothetical protein
VKSTPIDSQTTTFLRHQIASAWRLYWLWVIRPALFMLGLITIAQLIWIAL